MYLSELFCFLFSEEPLEIIVPLADIEIMETQTATLMCEVSKPNQVAKWIKDGKKEISGNGRYEIRVEDTKHFLLIKDAELSDQAEYTATFNADLSTSASVFVGGK